MSSFNYNAKDLSAKVDSFRDVASEAKKIQDRVKELIGEIEKLWTGTGEELAGRDKDFGTIINNVESTAANFTSIANFLDEKNTDFSQVRY